ncbi:MAG TPA: tRNA preQ1(34) S-adenosylmethionine ribosyltransferase-isomerase QueA [Actinobacteria bacterium]|nr:tRNA preQ1(34) S-adenosylmethionine ribosyltransferase-isomerase QueA [Actinomycetota bacterium]
MDVSAFDYDLPDPAIAQEPLEPRDAARLLRVPSLEDRRFSDLPELLDPGDLLVVNRARVRAARLRAHKDTGGALEVLLLRRLDDARWEALLRPARRVRAGTRFEVADRLAGRVLAAPRGGVAEVILEGASDVEQLVEEVGEVPLPPYIRRSLADPERYQTIFADRLGAAAAPTAGLHFTRELLDRLEAAGVRIASVELEVGLDTFRPIAAERLEDHRMHTERYHVPTATVEAVEETRRAGRRIVAVGTTVVRTLEAASGTGRLRAGEGATDLFITPGYVVRSVDALLTNFHAPRTTLVAMIAALVGPSWRIAYETALRRGYRFLSFGDAMLVEEFSPWR